IEEMSLATFTSPPIGSGAAGPLPLFASRLKLLESAGVAAFIARPGSAVPFSRSAALRVTFGAAKRTWPSAGFLATSSTTSSDECTGLFEEAAVLVPLAFARFAFVALPKDRAPAEDAFGPGIAAAGKLVLLLSEFAALPAGSVTGRLGFGAGMLAGSLS